MNSRNSQGQEPDGGAHQSWKSALIHCAGGNANPLLELLLSPATTDGQGNPTSFHPLPDDAELRLRIVRALITRPDWVSGSVSKWATHVGRGAGKPALSDREVSAIQAINDLLGRNRSGPKSLDFVKLAEAYGMEPETLRKRVAQRRRRQHGG